MKFKQFIKLSFCILLALLFVGCKTYSEEDHTNFDGKIQEYIKKHKLIGFEKSESGLYYKIIDEGKGEYIKLTDEVRFNYEGKLLNRNIFDGEHKKNPISFQMNELIQGWQEGMMYLKPGGKMKMIIPPHLGYGDYELDKIPPHSILYFEIEVIKVK